MNKLKITIQQENVLKEFNDIWKDKTVNERYELFLTTKKVSEIDADTDFLKPLTEIDSKDFFFMQHGWYEVEQPKFKVGDWVFDTDLQRYRKVTEAALYGVEFVPLVGANSLPYFEKVTEDWKIVLLELGREKPELKTGDKFTTKADDQNFEEYYTVTKNGDRGRFLKLFQNAKYFHPIESRIEFKK